MSAFVLSDFSHVQLFATLWTVPCPAPLSMGFSRQKDRSGLPCPPPRDLPGPGIEPVSLMSPALAEGFFTTSTWEAPYTLLTGIKNGVGTLENSWADSYKTKHVTVMPPSNSMLVYLAHESYCANTLNNRGLQGIIMSEKSQPPKATCYIVPFMQHY